MEELLAATATEQARAVRDGEVSATELVEAALREAERGAGTSSARSP